MSMSAARIASSSGVRGSASVALLKHMGAGVTAVCPTEHNAAVATLGADRMIDYRHVPFPEQLKGERFDFVFDAVGKSSFGTCRPLLHVTGAYISSELGAWGQNPILALAAPLMRGPKVRFPLPTDIPRTLATISPLLAKGAYRPLIDRRYRLEDIRDAFTYVDSGQKIGNVLVTMP